MRKTVATALLALSMFGGTVATASVASAAPADKCAKNPENFQVVNGVCVPDGKAERL